MDDQAIVPRPKRKIKLILLEAFLILLIIVLGVAIYLLSYQKTYAGKIYPNNTFIDLKIGGLSQKDATTLLDNYNKKLQQKKITIVTESKTLDITLADTGTELNIAKIITDAYNNGRDKNFFKELVKSAQMVFVTKEIPTETQTDNDKFATLITKLSNDLNQKAVDANITITNGVVNISNSQKGMVVDSQDLSQKILQIIESKSIKTIEPKTTFADPLIIESNLVSTKNQAEALLDKSATFKTDDQSIATTKTIIGDLISFNKSNPNQVTPYFDDSKISAFVAGTLAKKIDVAKTDRKISALNQAVISEGANGKHLDRSNAQTQFKNFLVGNELSTTIILSVIVDTFTDQIIYPNEGVVPGRFPGKYIDVDLTHQQMYLFDGLNLVAQYTVSTGKWSMPTPTGLRYILNKDPRAWSAKYGLYMPWWQSLGGGYGIHELPEWPNGYKEGESHLGTPVSHGCIRLGVGPAQTVYNWTEIGTPVWIHT